MRITVQRLWLTPASVCGELAIDGVFQCFTLEPPVRPGKPCCIPASTYEVLLLHSARFGFLTPHVLNVPDFSGIEIHPGNYPRDTHGCCLVGETHAPNFVGRSRPAFDALISRLLLNPVQITITYLAGPQNA